MFKIKTFIPPELVNIIADYHDYNKYCKPKHEKLFRVVVGDINLLGNLLKPIKPYTVWNSWGPPAQRRAHHGLIRNLPYQAYSTSTTYLEDEAIVSDDDEENNFGMNYDDTHYYSNDNDD